MSTLPFVQRYVLGRKCATHVLWSPEGDPGDAWDVLQPKLGNLLPGFLLIARVDGDGGPSREITSLDFAGLGLVLGVVVLDLDFLDLLLRNFLNAGVRHAELWRWGSGVVCDLCWCSKSLV